MISLPRWLSTKHTALNLLDMAYVIVLIPLIIMLKVPMILFSVMMLAILLFKHTPAHKWLVLFVFFVGVVAVYLSLYGAFNFRGLSRLKLFLELLVYVLIIVVSMQRLKREINFYLLVSPFLFLALSLFFYHGIVMLSYVIFEVFFILWMILAHRMNGEITEGFRSAMVMFLYSLPWVVILFIFFPRISFEHADYGFKAEPIQRMGHDGTMYLDGKALLVPSDRIVMEVGFDGKIPDVSQLYFRGSILYIDKKDHWEPLPSYIKRKTKVYYPTEGQHISYKVTLYPTQKRWLYLLDMPSRKVEKSTLDRDLITTVEKNIASPIHYEAHSSLSAHYSETLDKATYKASTYYDKTQNPQSYRHAMQIKVANPSPKARANALVKLFKTQSLTYTLRPDALDTNKTTDSFLFDKKRGYCVHFSSSFVTMARMLDIPARVVTGYKADKKDSLKNYLAVKEKNAHAWAELYLNKQWVRYETTSMASNIEDNRASQHQALTNTKNKENILLKKINLYLMYTKYQIETWILYYSHVRQLQLLDYAKKNPSFVFYFSMVFVFLLVFTFMMISYLKRPSYSSAALMHLQPLLKKLQKQGYTRQNDESMHQFLLRYIHNNPDANTIRQIDRLYQEILYAEGSSKEKLRTLKKYIKKSLS